MNQEMLSRLDGERRAQQSLLHLLCAVSIWRTAMTRILPLCGAAAWWVTLICLLLAGCGKTEEQPKAPEKKELQTAAPVSGQTVADYAMDCLSYNQTTRDWRTHNGIDISAPSNDPVKAGADGTVKKIYEDGMLGTVMEIEHNGFTARYCGLNNSTFVKEGDKVSQGQSIGTVGETAMEVAEESHIHLEVLENGKYINPDKLLK